MNNIQKESVTDQSKNKNVCEQQNMISERDCEINYYDDDGDSKYNNGIAEYVGILKCTTKEVLEYLKENPNIGHLSVFSCMLNNDIQRIENQLKSGCHDFGKIKKELRLIKEELMLINKALNNPNHGLCEIKEEIRLIEKQLSKSKGFCPNVTSGSVIVEDPCSTQLLVAVKNRNLKAQTVRVRVLRDDVCPAAVLADTCLLVSGCCTNAITVPFNNAATYEIEVFDLVPGMTVSSVEFDHCKRRIKCSRLVFSQFVCLFDECC